MSQWNGYSCAPLLNMASVMIDLCVRRDRDGLTVHHRLGSWTVQSSLWVPRVGSTSGVAPCCSGAHGQVALAVEVCESC